MLLNLTSKEKTKFNYILGIGLRENTEYKICINMYKYNLYLIWIIIEFNDKTNYLWNYLIHIQISYKLFYYNVLYFLSYRIDIGILLMYYIIF